jgi:hypothetical protein
MGNVKRRPDGKYRARYRDDAGKEHAKHFDRKIDADRWVTGQEAALDRGEHIDPRAGRVRFADYAAAWLANQVHLRDATKRQYEQALRLHILPVLGGRPLATVRRSDVQSLVNAWAAEGASAHSIAKLLLQGTAADLQERGAGRADRQEPVRGDPPPGDRGEADRPAHRGAGAGDRRRDRATLQGRRAGRRWLRAARW